MLSAISPIFTARSTLKIRFAALKWHRGLKKAILSLEEQPNRCPLTPESDTFWHLLYGNKPDIYRVIYRELEKHKLVEVLYVRHGARRTKIVQLPPV